MISDQRYYYPRFNLAVLAALAFGLSVSATMVGMGIAKLTVLL